MSFFPLFSTQTFQSRSIDTCKHVPWQKPISLYTILLRQINKNKMKKEKFNEERIAPDKTRTLCNKSCSKKKKKATLTLHQSE